MSIPVLCALLMCWSNTFAASSVEQKAVEVPFIYTQGKIAVSVKLVGQGPYLMQISTGSPLTVLDYSAAKQAGLNIVLSNPDNSAQPQDKLMAVLRSIEIGELKHSNLNVMIGGASGVVGMLGSDFLKQYVVQIDFPQHVIRFYKTSPFGKNIATAEGTKAALPLRFDEREKLPVVENILVNGKKIKATLDTGFPGTLALTPEAGKHLGLKSVDEKSKRESRQLDTLAVGTIKVDLLSALLYGKGGGLDKSFESLGGIIGNGLMENYTVTFDYQNKLVVFQ